MGEVVELGLGGGSDGGLDNGRRGKWGGGGVQNTLAGETLGSGGGGLVVVVSGGLDGSAHLADDFSVVGLLFLGNEVGEVGGAGLVKHIGGIIGFGVELVAHRGAAGFNGLAFGINYTGEEGEAMRGFFFGDIAGARGFHFARGGD